MNKIPYSVFDVPEHEELEKKMLVHEENQKWVSCITVTYCKHNVEQYLHDIIVFKVTQFIV